MTRGSIPLDTGRRLTLNIQPVVPFSLNADWISHLAHHPARGSWSDDALVNSGRIFRSPGIPLKPLSVAGEAVERNH